MRRSWRTQLLEEFQQEWAIRQFGMRNMQAGFVDAAPVVAKDVDVALARTPAPPLDPANLVLDALDGFQTWARLQRSFHLEHLVQEQWLVGDAHRRCLADLGFADDGDTGGRQTGPCRRQVSSSVTHVAAQCQPHSGHVRTIASAIRATRTIALTS